MAKAASRPPNKKDYDDFKRKHGGSPVAHGVGMKRDGEGVYVHTHRARSKSYPSAANIPASVVKRIESTG